MIKNSYITIGVMSGTSLDGVDLAHIHFTIAANKWHFSIEACETIPYSQEWVEKLKIATTFSQGELQKLNQDYTQLPGSIIKDFILRQDLKNIDAVCSHGHTILHQPQNGFTLQIGNLPDIKNIINQRVVCDFRVQDVQLGGQGAPLVPIGDRILFADYEYCLNLGGFSNVSFEEGQKRIAFDISPVNTVLNFYANQLALPYDDEGKISKEGHLNPELYNQLNALDFYHKSYPKSLGFEFVKEIIFPVIERFPISISDKMHTFTEHIAYQIGKALAIKKGKLLVTGGGAYNKFLLNRIQFHLPEMEIIVPDPKILEFKEALIFALLGVLKLRNEVNVLSSVTGASKDHSSGVVL